MNSNAGGDRDVVVVQGATQNRWTPYINWTSHFRYPHSSPLKRTLRELKMLAIQKASKIKVLEYGFGHGHVLFWFRPPSELHGIDLSCLAVESAEKRAIKGGYLNYQFSFPPEEDSVRIMYPENYFDIVICSHTLEHVYDDEKLLKELYRVQKPGAFLILLVPQDAQENNAMNNESIRRNPFYPTNTYHVWWYNVDTIKYLAENAGFLIERITDFDAVGSKLKNVSRISQIIHSAFMKIAPDGVWEHYDLSVRNKGYRCKQIVLVAKKPLL